MIDALAQDQPHVAGSVAMAWPAFTSWATRSPAFTTITSRMTLASVRWPSG